MHKLCTCLCGIKGPWAEGILVGCVVGVCVKITVANIAEEINYMVIMQQFRSKMKILSDVLLIPYGA